MLFSHKHKPVNEMLAELSKLNLEFFEKLLHPKLTGRTVKLLQSAELSYREIRDSLKTVFVTQIERGDYLLIAQLSIRTAYNVEEIRIAGKHLKLKMPGYDKFYRLLQQLYRCIHNCITRLQDLKKPEFENKLHSAVTENRRIQIEWRNYEILHLDTQRPIADSLLYRRMCSALNLLDTFVYALEMIWMKNI